MATRTWPGFPINGGSASGAALSGAAAATVLTYTVPTGRQAMLRWVSLAKFTGAPTVAVRVTTGGATMDIGSYTAAVQITPNIPLNAADTVTLVVTGIVAASVFDGIIGAEEYPAA